jgi:hypothetical protein
MKSIMAMKGKEDTYTKLTVNISEPHPYEPGQYYFICVPEISGEWHPISVADHSACHEKEGETTLVFFIKSMGIGTWSHKLSTLRDISAADCVTFSPPSTPGMSSAMSPVPGGGLRRVASKLPELARVASNATIGTERSATPVRGVSMKASAPSTPERSASKRQGKDRGRDMDEENQHRKERPKSMPMIAFDGPYGRLALDIAHHDTVGIICGGVGVTAMLTTLEWIVAQKTAGGLKRLRNVEFHWVVRGLNPLYSIFRMRLCLVVASCIGIKWETEEGEESSEEEEEDEEDDEDEDEGEDEEEDEDEGALVASEAVDLGMDPHLVARMSTRALKQKTKAAKKEAEAAKHRFRVSTKVYNSAAGKTEAASSLTNTVVVNGRPQIEKIVAALGSCRRVALLLCGPKTLTHVAAEEARKYSNIHVHNETFGY